MAVSKEVKFEDIKAGDTIEVTIITKVLEVDPNDTSLRLEARHMDKWLFPKEYENVTMKVVQPPLIPGNASALEYKLKDGAEGHIFAVKRADGSWEDSDTDRFADDAAMEASIREHGDVSTVVIYDKRGA